MNRFTLNSKVVILSCEDTDFWYGAVGTVVGLPSEYNMHRYEIKLDRDGRTCYFSEQYLGHAPTLSEVSVDPINTTLPTESNARKEYPMYSGLLRYFPSALAGCAKVSKIGNDKHNPGQPLHHSRGKSSDHADCIIRHLLDLSEDRGKGIGYDENGVAQVDYIVWRALALSQEWHEKNEGKPLAPGAKE